ncbi:hypothetical protein SAMN04487775_1094 [Treponema bryantii]|uniref:Lipoprotein n=1 Tax=Treponema bryantii TaxID=163 RepID=A0A1I3MF69_9SPIR|nr:hypothetical protein [Treponema bryantii]SFI95754.1 hypothetical protein SAMN04487775_1094 [Treponema bryantii]
MKKLLTISAVLLAAALVFTGCSNPAANSGDEGEKLPGTWSSSVTYYNDYNQNGWTLKNNTISYKCDDPTTLQIPTNKVQLLSLPISSDKIYGVNVKLKQAKFTDSEYGILFLESGDSSDNTNSYYRLTLWQNSYILYEKLSGHAETLLSVNGEYQNIVNNAIKKEGEENDVLFYTEGEELVLKINGTEIKRIANKLDKGRCHAYVRIPYDATESIAINYNFVNFQTAK